MKTFEVTQYVQITTTIQAKSAKAAVKELEHLGVSGVLYIEGMPDASEWSESECLRPTVTDENGNEISL